MVTLGCGIASHVAAQVEARRIGELHAGAQQGLGAAAFAAGDMHLGLKMELELGPTGKGVAQIALHAIQRLPRVIHHGLGRVDGRLRRLVQRDRHPRVRAGHHGQHQGRVAHRAQPLLRPRQRRLAALGLPAATHVTLEVGVFAAATALAAGRSAPAPPPSATPRRSPLPAGPGGKAASLAEGVPTLVSGS